VWSSVWAAGTGREVCEFKNNKTIYFEMIISEWYIILDDGGVT